MTKTTGTTKPKADLLQVSGAEIPARDLVNQLVVGQIQLDRCYGNVTRRDRVQVRSRLAGPPGRAAADPEVVPPERVLATDELVVVLAPSQPRDLHASN